MESQTWNMHAVLVGSALAVTLVLWATYRALLPRPIPGVPHYAESTKRVSGDLPIILSDFESTKEVSESRYAHCRKLGSPVIQLFMSFLSRPVVFLDDPRETEDILLRRNKEFDRSPISSETIGVLMPHCTIVKSTTPEFKAQRRIWMDVMTPDFLRGVLAPKIHVAAMELVDLWKLKRVKAENHAINVSHDFDAAALDAIWSAILGDELGGIKDKISKVEGIKAGSTTDYRHLTPVDRGVDMQETVRLLDVVTIVLHNSWVPSLSRWFVRRTSRFRKYTNVKDEEINRILRAASARFQKILDGTTDGSEHDTCAMDLVLRRSMLAAQKAGNPAPDPTKDLQFRDELMLLLWAGHDTTSNTLSWFVKYMTNNPDVQSKLRQKLRDAFPGDSLPDVSAIFGSDIPYLDGAVEETLRLAATTGRVNRITKVDAEVLGYVIPAGTDIIMNGTMTQRPVPVREEIRSPSSRAANEKVRRGGIDGPAGDKLPAFQPERWLYADEDGKEVFDANALPKLAFGNGPRGCFGRRLAMQELRIMMVLVMLSFHFDTVPDHLNSMHGIELMFRKPEQCYVKLRTL